MNTDLGVATVLLWQSEGAEGRNGEDDLTEPALLVSCDAKSQLRPRLLSKRATHV